MSKTVVMSSGGALMRYKEELKKLYKAKCKFFTFSNSFMFCVNELGIYPDYFAFIDPNSAMPSLEHICNNKEKIKTKVIFLDPLHTKLNYKEYQNWYGTTPVGRINNYGGWERLHQLVKEIQNADLAINIPSYTTKYLKNNPETISSDKIIIYKDSNTDNPDKLTSVVLPILEKLNIHNIALIGFDCVGGRYLANLGDKYSLSKQPELKNYKKDYVVLPQANRGMEEAKQTIKKFLPLWVNKKGFNITNLVEDQHTFLKHFIPYQPIEQLIK